MKKKIKKLDVVEIKISKDILKQLQNRKPAKSSLENEKRNNLVYRVLYKECVL